MVRKHPNVLRLEKIIEQERRDWGVVLGFIQRRDWLGFLGAYVSYLEGRHNYSPSRLALVFAFKSLLNEVSPTRTWEESPETD